MFVVMVVVIGLAGIQRRRESHKHGEEEEL
jgi:hypothetical protein